MTRACVHANGIDIHYVEAGEGEPLLLLDNAMVSTNPVWAAIPFAYASFLGTLARHFRVIAPDTRGSGKTVHPGGPIPSALLADDLAALIDALNLDRPLICGFSDGGETATLVGIRHPGSVRAIVNHGGYDLFNPDPHAPAIAMTRQMLGGSAGATQADPEVSAGRSPELRAMFELMKADHDSAQGAGHWKTVIARTFDRVTQPHGYTVENLNAITVPALILTGDRDPFCTIEDGAAAYRALPAGAFAVLPDTGHLITPAAVRATIEFFERLDH
ncbi:MAG TPA: alpha/beta hydrolase [Streptosporangiaceae bacterium]|jgi:pimeloyl-ACP methyl ester carboxylesterase|nr:alpha/beta hydrolase [Streptosporangiaceae bacterium]